MARYTRKRSPRTVAIIQTVAAPRKETKRIKTYLEEDIARQKVEIESYAGMTGLKIDSFVEIAFPFVRRKVARPVFKSVFLVEDFLNRKKLYSRDCLVVSDMSRLGMNAAEVASSARVVLLKRGVAMVLCRQGIRLGSLKALGRFTDDITAIVMAAGREADARWEAFGGRFYDKHKKKRRKVGRPPGSRSKRLDRMKPCIEGYIGEGRSVASVSRLTGIKRSTLIYFIKTRNIRKNIIAGRKESGKEQKEI